MSGNPPEVAADASPAAPARPILAGVVARWIGSLLLLAAIFAWLTGLPGAGPILIAGGILLIAGMAFSLADGRRRPAEAGPPAPTPLLAVLTLVMAVTAFLLGASRTMASAPSSSNDFLLEGVALVASLVLVVLAVVAFAEPRLRLRLALVSMATVGALFLFSLALA